MWNTLCHIPRKQAAAASSYFVAVVRCKPVIGVWVITPYHILGHPENGEENKAKIVLPRNTIHCHGHANTIIQGTAWKGTAWGRQRKKWTNDIEEWTEKPFSDIQVLAHDHERWIWLVDSKWHSFASSGIFTIPTVPRLAVCCCSYWEIGLAVGFRRCPTSCNVPSSLPM